MTGQHAVPYDRVLDAARKYAAGFKSFDLPTAQHAIAGQLGYNPADWLKRMIRHALEELVIQGELVAYPRGAELPGGGTSIYREYRTPAEDMAQPAAPGRGLAWRTLPGGGELARGTDCVYLITWDERTVALTRWEPRPGETGSEVAPGART